MVRILLFLVFLLSSTALVADQRLDEAQRQLDAEQPQVALGITDQVIDREGASGRALLIRSTAKIQLGLVEDGQRDLRRALELDPALRQGWLNLAGIEIAFERWPAALEALREAERLDPGAPDNHLNLGTVLLMKGDIEAAAQRFDRYLASRPNDPDAFFQVAGNYALASDEPRAVAALQRAVAIDERMRMRIRADRRFGLFTSVPFQTLMTTDRYQPPVGAHRTAVAFQTPYMGEDGELIEAVLKALRAVGETFDPRVEANPRWALIWADMRIKLFSQADGTGVVEMTAPVTTMNKTEWERRTQRLLRAIHNELTSLPLRVQ
ncbi:MAG: tetratricopeptide repeat protein [Acidobacteriota bacterium]